MDARKRQELLKSFIEPLLVLGGITLYGILLLLKLPAVPFVVIFVAIIIGSYRLFKESWESLQKHQYALDYIAMLAVVISILTREYFVASIIALMISTGRNLEEYGVRQARQSLTKLVDRIPSHVTVWENGSAGKSEKIAHILVGHEVLIRKGEVIPLDGTLQSEAAVIDESSLTGEPYMVEKQQGDLLRSGTVNTGDAVVLKVTKAEKDSTYRKIINLVESAQDEKAPLVRLADRYSTIFTIITFAIAGFAYLHLHTLEAILAVLVVATPCPLILATPIALLGGVNKAAKQRIIVKKLASIEALSRVQAFIFDKTGTITLGKPKLSNVTIHDKAYTKQEVLVIAQALERNSLHPLAKAVVDAAKEQNVPFTSATQVEETLGSGISGMIHGKRFTVQRGKQTQESGISLDVLQEKNSLATLHFMDEVKSDSKQIISRFAKLGLRLFIFTGDKQHEADRIASLLGEKVTIKAELSPEDKEKGIEALKSQGKTVVMLGDGINDAPALARADVGMVFSNEEQTAASEAADIVLLGGDFALAFDTLAIAKRTIRIAMQSIIWGIGLSIVGQLFAAWGLLPPLFGAGIQEAIDVAVILNALRASR